MRRPALGRSLAMVAPWTFYQYSYPSCCSGQRAVVSIPLDAETQDAIRLDSTSRDKV